MAVHVSHCILSEVSVQDTRRQGGSNSTQSFIQTVRSERPDDDRGDKHPSRSCPHDPLHSTQVFSIGDHGVPEGQDRHQTLSRTARSDQAVLGTPHLVARVLRLYHRSQRGSDSKVRQVAARA